ncbi:MAG: AmmeMemoRadiSam system radical SAM enzyme [Calditrichia bacterium]|nr:AmmeMemoRadiSam system radical SAM enzyme [Calditrichia bacterium]
MTTAKFWKSIPGNKIECLLCPRKCIIPEESHGYCYVRKNNKGKLYSLAYAHPSAMNVDPIEKKPLYHVLPNSKSFSIGTIGCNLGCKFCQNWSLSRSKDDTSRVYELEPSKIIELCKQHNCSSIAFTYNEPTIFAEYVMDIAKLAKENNIKTVMVTNGYINDSVIKEVYKNIDAANVDLKAFSEDFYKNETSSSLQPVLNSLKILNEMGVWVEITNLIIPGLNDDEIMIKKMLNWILKNLGDKIPLHFSAFHPDYKLTDIEATSAQNVINIRNLALNHGIRYVYCGNILYKEGNTTYCPKCNKPLIIRDWGYTENKLSNLNQCNCGEIIPGIYK